MSRSAPRHPSPGLAPTELPPPVADGSAPPAPPASGSWIAPTRPFRSGRTLATVVRALLVAAIVVAGFDAAANVDVAQLLGRLQADANAVTLAELDASDRRTGVAGLLLVAVLVAALGFLIAWTSRLYRNLAALGVGRAAVRGGVGDRRLVHPLLQPGAAEADPERHLAGQRPGRRRRLAAAAGHAPPPLVVGPLDLWPPCCGGPSARARRSG